MSDFFHRKLHCAIDDCLNLWRKNEAYNGLQISFTNKKNMLQPQCLNLQSTLRDLSNEYTAEMKSDSHERSKVILTIQDIFFQILIH